MSNAAILVGNSRYDSLSDLPCCHDDLRAIKELLEATERYSDIEVIENADADHLKTTMRQAIDKFQSTDELFFYFSGHGCQQEQEFYYCAPGFNPKRPNKTGISTSELHDLLRLAEADVVVKVVDACNSGTVLVKSGQGFVQEREHGFRSLIQISSCLDSQNSLAGQPLSVFTAKFRDSALSKTEGPVHYTDIIYTLKDEFVHNEDQIPFFVFQGTGREQFVDDASRLQGLREKILTQSQSSSLSESEETQIVVRERTLNELLDAAENRAATPEKIESFVDNLFDSLRERLTDEEFSEFFELHVEEHSDFEEPSAEGLIIRVMSQESRADEFVTASRKKDNTLGSMFNLWTGLRGDQGYRETYDLRLNCHMKRAQLKFSMTPKYHSLKMLTLVVTCAPSLEHCYVFEVVAQHSLEDFGRYNAKGEEIVRRWYKFDWSESADEVVGNLVAKLNEAVRDHLERTHQRLNER